MARTPEPRSAPVAPPVSPPLLPAGFAAAAASAASTLTSTEPLETLSPTRTLTSRTTPPAVAGTSIVAFSDSSVTSGASFVDPLAGLHEHLDDRDVGEIADVGDGEFEERHQTVTGLGLSGSMP